MACACKNRAKTKYLWTPPEGSDLEPVIYDSLIVAKAKVQRKGGSYQPVPV